MFMLGISAKKMQSTYFQHFQVHEENKRRFGECWCPKTASLASILFSSRIGLLSHIMPHSQTWNRYPAPRTSRQDNQVHEDYIIALFTKYVNAYDFVSIQTQVVATTGTLHWLPLFNVLIEEILFIDYALDDIGKFIPIIYIFHAIKMKTYIFL